MGLLDVLCGRLPLFKSTQRRQYVGEIEQDFERLINAPYHWKQPPTGPYNPDDFSQPLPPEVFDPEYSIPQFAEYTTNGGNILAVLSDTPENGKKWEILDMQGWVSSAGGTTLHFFLLAPGFTFIPALINTNFGSQAPGTIRLGIGKSVSATEDLTNITGGTLMEGSPLGMKVPDIESGWKIGIVETANNPGNHSIGLRLVFRQTLSKATTPNKSSSGRTLRGLPRTAQY